MPRTRLRGGQSLVEVLVAVAIGVILITGALAIITPTLKSQTDVTRTQVAAALGRELLENVKVFSEADWHNIDGLATTSANRYYLVASTSPFAIATGTESVVVATTTYTRSFYLDQVYRNGSGKIDSSGTLDPSTKKITVQYGWGSTSGSFQSYLTRSYNSVLLQTDWSGGGGDDGPISTASATNKFSTSSGIDYATSSGSIVIQGF